jgi:hypothetical protein
MKLQLKLDTLTSNKPGMNESYRTSKKALLKDLQSLERRVCRQVECLLDSMTSENPSKQNLHGMPFFPFRLIC